METVEIPAMIPKAHADRFGSSIIAFQSGHILAAIFLLRVFIEQYWRSIGEVMKSLESKKRPTGDEIGAAYKSTLPSDFKERFPTLCEVYNDLSAAIHSATEDPNIYIQASVRIQEHFDARRLYKLNKV